jgi:hypothetical protein
MSSVSPIKWANDKTPKYDCATHIQIDLNIFWNRLPFFTVSVPNKSFNGFNLLGLLVRALESESIGMQKYSQLKYKLQTNGMWTKL